MESIKRSFGSVGCSWYHVITANCLIRWPLRSKNNRSHSCVCKPSVCMRMWEVFFVALQECERQCSWYFDKNCVTHYDDFAFEYNSHRVAGHIERDMFCWHATHKSLEMIMEMLVLLRCEAQNTTYHICSDTCKYACVFMSVCVCLFSFTRNNCVIPHWAHPPWLTPKIFWPNNNGDLIKNR